MTVNDIFEFLNGIAPVNTACDFDNAGILVGNPSAEVSGAVVALDCTASAIKTAIKNNCELIITHHPLYSTAEDRTYGQYRFRAYKKRYFGYINAHKSRYCRIGR